MYQLFFPAFKDIKVTRHLAGQDVSESREGIIQGLVVNGLVQIFDEDVSNPGFPK